MDLSESLAQALKHDLRGPSTPEPEPAPGVHTQHAKALADITPPKEPTHV